MKQLKNMIMPLPKEIKQENQNILISGFVGQVYVNAAETCDMISEGVKVIKKALYNTGMVTCGDNEKIYNIVLKTDAADDVFKGIESDEAYYIKTDENGTLLCGKGTAGTFYAAITFAQMIFLEDDGVFVPKAFVKDFPDFPFRGHFMECRYGSEFMTKNDWFDAIDYFSETKINRVTIGVYGCWHRQYDKRWMEYLYIPLEKYPDIKTYKNIKYFSVLDNKWVYKNDILPYMYEEDYLGDVIDYAKKRNIVVRPLFNSLGHNTLIPKSIPEIAAKDEEGNPKGYGFCTKNEKTYEVMFSIYDNIIDKYLTPRGINEIEIGLDEVMPVYECHCDKCKDFTHAELIVEYMIKLCKYLKEKGMKKIYIYHDMLYHKFGIVNEELKEKFVSEGIYDEVVLDWWTYEDPAHLFWDKADGVNNIFHSIIKPDTGYYNWLIPTENNENIRACAAMATRLEFEGIEAYGSFDKCFDKNYLTLAEVAWNKDTIEDEDDFNRRYALRLYPDSAPGAEMALRSLSDTMKDETHIHYMNRISRFFEYYNYSYCRDGQPYPQKFPEEAFKKIINEEDVYLNYLEFIRQKSYDALRFFDSGEENGKMHDLWLLTAKQYYTDADEYLTVYGLYKEYNASAVDAYKVISELDRLIKQRENLMAFAEKVKMKATSYLYLRNMSIFLQILKDIKNYFKKTTDKGEKPVFDVTDLSNILGEKVNFLR